MSIHHDPMRPYRASQGGACIAFGLIAAAAAIASAVLIFGPLADQKALVMSGSSSRTDPSVSAASTPLRVASSDRQTVR